MVFCNYFEVLSKQQKMEVLNYFSHEICFCTIIPEGLVISLVILRSLNLQKTIHELDSILYCFRSSSRARLFVVDLTAVVPKFCLLMLGAFSFMSSVVTSFMGVPWILLVSAFFLLFVVEFESSPKKNTDQQINLDTCWNVR